MPQKYFVSYIVVPSVARGRGYRQHAVFLTDDLDTVVMQIVPTRRSTGRGKLPAQLREYRERGTISFGKPDDPGVIKDVVIRKLPERDAKVLAKYL